MNRRNFFQSILAIGAGFTILPGAGRLWVPREDDRWMLDWEVKINPYLTLCYDPSIFNPITQVPKVIHRAIRLDKHGRPVQMTQQECDQPFEDGCLYDTVRDGSGGIINVNTGQILSHPNYTQ